MFIFKLCYEALKECFAPPSASSARDVEVNERTVLTRGGRGRNTVVLPPSQQINRQGFSAGFVNFFESKGGVIFGCINLAIYYTSSVIAFAFIFEPDWTIIDALYFATVTFTTIGYGDITPSTDGGRLFTVVFSLYGIFILGFFAGLIGEKVVEAHNVAVEAVEARGRKRVTEMFGAVSTSLDGSIASSAGATLCEAKNQTVFAVVCSVLQLELPLVGSILALGVCYGVLVEGWTVIESLYYAAITASTVGYGDYAPSEQWSRLLCVFLLPLAVAVFCEVLGRIAGSYLDYKIQLQEQKFLHRQLTLSDLDSMDADRDGTVVWGEFLAFMLVAMQKVDKADVDELRKVFDHLDKTGTGKLNKDDIEGIVRQRSQRKLQLSALD